MREENSFPAASNPKMARATFAGSGTSAVKSNSQMFSVLCAPADMSAKNSVQLPFGSCPVYELNATRLAESKLEGEEFGSMFRPSACQVPVNCPDPLKLGLCCP